MATVGIKTVTDASCHRYFRHCFVRHAFSDMYQTESVIIGVSLGSPALSDSDETATNYSIIQLKQSPDKLALVAHQSEMQQNRLHLAKITVCQMLGLRCLVK